MTALAGWENFDVIVGSSAGGLIGLQFVVITLLAGRPAGPGQAQARSAFAAPTIVPFGAVLLVAADISAPWRSLGGAAVLWGLLGLTGVIYTLLVARRMGAKTTCKHEFEDWLCHAILPVASYAALILFAPAVRGHASGAMFGVAAASLVLLFIGIHNAWDAATYHLEHPASGKHHSQERGTG